MNFRTEIPNQRREKGLIDYQSKTFLIGSCFVENMGEKLSYFKFQSLENPVGILFNPVSIDNFLNRVAKQMEFQDTDVFEFQDIWQSFEVHSQMNSLQRETIISNLNEQLKLTKKFLESASHVIITLGTAWVYRNIKSNNIVANCHKIPQKEFKKELLSIEEIVASIQSILSLLKAINDNLTVIFTVSPVRHLKDGFVENSLSKAHLLSAIHQVLHQENVSYFPSYEIMMDELRDYRFYAADMIHPSQQAVDYIWEKFKSVWIHSNCDELMKRIDRVQKGLNHKPFNLSSAQHQEFLQKLNEEKLALASQFSHISF